MHDVHSEGCVLSPSHACARCARVQRRTLQLARLFMVRARRGLSPLPAWPGAETTMQTVTTIRFSTDPGNQCAQTGDYTCPTGLRRATSARRATGFICCRRSRRLTIRGRGRRARARRLRSLQAEVGHGATLVFFDLRRAPGDGPKQPKQPPPPPLTCSTA